jgi:RNA polymerase sigma-70 factor (ECF subfamily)
MQTVPMQAQPDAVRIPVDERLVSAARAGDRGAFGRLFEQFAPMVHGILLARVPQGEADDLVQEVFLAALERIATLRDGDKFGGWLAMIARNRVIDRMRHRPNLVALPSDLATHDPRRSEAAQVLEVIRSLPEAYSETLILRLVEGMTGPEIAERVGLTPDSVRVNLHRGMALLRERLGSEEKE